MNGKRALQCQTLKLKLQLQEQEETFLTGGGLKIRSPFDCYKSKLTTNFFRATFQASR